MDEWQWAKDWLSEARLAPYFASANGDISKALDLYKYNSRLSAAIKIDLDHVEVAVRNAYDRAMDRYPSSGHWVFNGGALFPSTSRRGDLAAREQLQKAMRDAGGSAAPPGKVIAELTMGFWKRFSEQHRESVLWAPYANKAFANGTPRDLVHEHMTHLVKLRNRIAHSERIVHVPIASYRARVHDLAKRIDPKIAEWIRDASTVDGVQKSWARYQQQHALRQQPQQQQQTLAPDRLRQQPQTPSREQKARVDRLLSRGQLPGNTAYRERKTKQVNGYKAAAQDSPNRKQNRDDREWNQ